MVIDENGQNLGEMGKREALELAYSKELDLIVVSKGDKVVVARIGDVSKVKYEKAKKIRKSKASASAHKEWWFKPNIQERDLEIRLQKVKKFLDKGGTAKLTLRYIPRAKVPAEQMLVVMNMISSKVGEFAKIITPSTKEGRNLSILVKSNA